MAELLEQFVELVKDWLSRTLLMNIQDQNSIFEVKIRRLFVKQERVGASTQDIWEVRFPIHEPRPIAATVVT